jgi:trigger factor
MGTVTRENIGHLTDKITVKVEKNDYLPSFEKALKEYGKKANIPGFRKGMVPSGLIKKMYGSSVFTDEVLKSVEKNLTDYMTSEHLEIFAQPLPLPENDARQLNMTQPDAYSFAFEVGLKPAFELPDFSSLTPTRYKILISEDMINAEMERLQLKNGKMTDPETITGDDNVLNVSFTETDPSGNEVEGAASKDNSLLVKYFSESFRPNLIGRKKDDEFVFQLSAAFDEKERAWILNDLGQGQAAPDSPEKFYRLRITKVGLVERAAPDEAFFKSVYPSKEIKTEAEFREAVKDDIASQWQAQTRNQLQHSLYHELLIHTRIEFPEPFLKRWLLTGGDKPKTPEEVEHEFPAFANALKWSLITDKLSQENKIEVAQEDIKAAARKQLFSYLGGLPQGGDQAWVEDYVVRMMQDKKFVEETYQRIKTDKMLALVEERVSAIDKEVSAEDFNRMQSDHEHEHHHG